MFRVFNTRLVPQRTNLVLRCNFASGAASDKSTSQPNIPDVKGFTDRVVKVPQKPVGFAGSTKDSDYKNPEYFCYHVDSFGDSMLELEKYRLPAPSNKAKK